MNPSSMLFWNVRGLNNKAHRDAIWDVILSSKADIVCLQETKLGSVN
jgi:exonuclease III